MFHPSRAIRISSLLDGIVQQTIAYLWQRTVMFTMKWRRDKGMLPWRQQNHAGNVNTNTGGAKSRGFVNLTLFVWADTLGRRSLMLINSCSVVFSSPLQTLRRVALTVNSGEIFTARITPKHPLTTGQQYDFPCFSLIDTTCIRRN